MKVSFYIFLNKVIISLMIGENLINLDRQVSYQYFVNLKKFNMALLNKHLIRYNLIKAIHHIF